MSVYANKFTLEINDVARIVFVDERTKIADGVPGSQTTVADVVMTHANLLALGELISRLSKKHGISK